MCDKYDESSDSRFCLFKRVKIYRHDNQLYINRLIIIRCSFFAIMLHKIYLSDNDCMHDHPWGFLSIILSRGYWEFTPLNKDFETNHLQNCKWYGRGSILYRPAKWIHRLVLRRIQELNHKPTVTLVITGKKIRDWGFWTKLGWLYHKDYNNVGSCE